MTGVAYTLGYANRNILQVWTRSQPATHPVLTNLCCCLSPRVHHNSKAAEHAPWLQVGVVHRGLVGGGTVPKINFQACHVIRTSYYVNHT